MYRFGFDLDFIWQHIRHSNVDLFLTHGLNVSCTFCFAEQRHEAIGALLVAATAVSHARIAASGPYRSAV